MSNIFGEREDCAKPYSFWGMSGWFSVPAGRNWYCMIDKGMQLWASPNPLTKNDDGSVSGTAPVYAAEMAPDGTLVFQDKMAQRNTNVDSPAHDRLSPNN